MHRVLTGLLLAATGGCALAQDTIYRDSLEELAAPLPSDSCEGVEAQTGFSNQTQPSSWAALFPGYTWPAPIGNFKWLTVQNNSIVSLPISIDSSFSAAAGTVELAEASGMPTAPLVVTISKCRGDFRMATLVNSERNCMGYGTSAPFVVWVKDGAPNANYCPMQSGVSYWLNISYMNVPITSPATSSCPGFGSCTTIVGDRTLSRAQLEQFLEAVAR